MTSMIDWVKEAREFEDFFGKMLSEEKRAAVGSTQTEPAIRDAVQRNPLPNDHGKWSDSELVLNFRNPAEARAVYKYALTMIADGEVNLNMDYVAERFTVHVMPAVVMRSPSIVRRLLAQVEEDV